MINLYCDESCHLEHDQQKIMVIGAISCPDRYREEIYQDIRSIKMQHGLSPHYEMKWTKVSPGQIAFYQEIVQYFFDNEILRFRAVILPDKSRLKHKQFHQTHDDFYYKMYYYVIMKFLNEKDQLSVYIDIKDTRSEMKIDKLKEILCNKAQHGFKSVNKIQQIRSHENSILQLADVLIGAVSYINRSLKGSEAKLQICKLLVEKANQSLTKTSRYGEEKFNLLVFDQF